MQVSRRNLITGLATVLAAPAIVRTSSLMPISPMPATVELLPYPGGVPTASEILRRQEELYERVWKQLAVDPRLLSRQRALEATIREAVAMSVRRLARASRQLATGVPT